MLPDAVTEHVSRAYAFCSDLYVQAGGVYEQAENALVLHAPTSLHPLIERVARAVPETLFCLAMFTDVFKPVTTFVWAAKSVWVIYPFIDAVLIRGDLDKRSMDTARDETKERFDKTMQRLTPAVVTSALVVAAFFAVMGVTSLSFPLLSRASFFASLAYLSYSDVVAPRAANVVMPNVVAQNRPQSPSSLAPSAPPLEQTRR